MSDNGGLDILIYIILTIGASIVGAIKSAKNKNQPTPIPMEYPTTEEADGLDESFEDIQRQESFESMDRAMVTETLENEQNFLTHLEEQERIRQYNQLQERTRRNERLAGLFKEDFEETSEENATRFNIKEAIISSEILNRKY